MKHTPLFPMAGPDAEQIGNIYRQIISLIDLTTLNTEDNLQKVRKLCDDAIQYQTAAVCIFPSFVARTRDYLRQKGSSLRLACVAAGFPCSQTPLEVKCFEVNNAVENGADEIDVVLSVGEFLAGNNEVVTDELKAIRKACQGKTLKVILETSLLPSDALIRKASEIAIEAGADFLKTSTGKTPVSATPEAFYVMLEVIREHYEKTGQKVGIKAAGGISKAEQALPYFMLVQQVLGEAWLNPSLFRFGASRLLEDLLRSIG